MNDSQEILEALGPVLREALAERDQRITILERRLSEIEARPVLRDGGVYSSKHSYREGDCVTHAGSLWVAQRATNGIKPGTSETWRLAVKKGRDARDLKRAKLRADVSPLPISNVPKFLERAAS